MNTVAIYNINMAKYRLIVKKGNKNQKKMRNIKLVPTYSNDNVEIEKEINARVSYNHWNSIQLAYIGKDNYPTLIFELDK